MTYSLVTASARTLLPDPTIPIEVRPQQSVITEVLTWARFAPERVAVSAGGRHWTYAELAARATFLATTLQEMGIGRGDVVAIIGPRSFGLIGTMLGVLMSGGAFLTIDPTLPAQRKRVMLREARAKVLCLIGQPGDSDRHLEADEALPVLRADLDLASLPGAARSSDRAWSLPTIHGRRSGLRVFHIGQYGPAKGNSRLPQRAQSFPTLAAQHLRDRHGGSRFTTDRPHVRSVAARRLLAFDQRRAAVPANGKRSFGHHRMDEA